MGDITSLVSVNLQECTDITGEPASPVPYSFVLLSFLLVLSSQPCSLPLVLWQLCLHIYIRCLLGVS